MSSHNISYQCKYCGNEVSKDEKICPNCNSDLAKTGRNISLTLDEYINLSEKEKARVHLEDIKWDTKSLGFLGVFTGVFLGITVLMVTTMGPPYLPIIIMGLALTLLFIILITQVKIIRILTIRFLIAIFGNKVRGSN